MRVNHDWKDYEIIATGDGEKLERWGQYYLLRPDPQVIWKSSSPLGDFSSLHAHYNRSSSGGGEWNIKKKMPPEWVVCWKDLKFSLKLMGFKHTGIFPEQAYNWQRMIDLIKKAGRPVKVLNLFAYTGGATLACAYAGASVTHVDASKGMNDRARENLALSGLADAPVRTIVDDCEKFIEREIRRGNKYDAVIMDPPSYGRGPKGEIWKIEEKLFDFVSLTKQILSDNPLFVLLNSYTTGLQPTVIQNVMQLNYQDAFLSYEAYEIGLPTNEKIVLPCGASCFASNEK